MPGVYSLRAVVRHVGRSGGSGHYVTDAREGAEWMNHNDSRTEATTEVDVTGPDAGKEAYLLMYQRAETAE